MEFDEQEFSDADDELLAHADLPQGNKDLNYGKTKVLFSLQWIFNIFQI